MDCPICSTQLTAQTHEGVPVDVCPEGHGTYLNAGELRQVAQRIVVDRPEHEEQAEYAEANARDASASISGAYEREGTRACPECGRAMAKVYYAESSSIVIDSCVEHGVWLDTGERERVEAFAEAWRKERVPPPRRVGGIPIPPGILQGINTNVPPPTAR